MGLRPPHSITAHPAFQPAARVQGHPDHQPCRGPALGFLFTFHVSKISPSLKKGIFKTTKPLADHSATPTGKIWGEVWVGGWGRQAGRALETQRVFCHENHHLTLKQDAHLAVPPPRPAPQRPLPSSLPGRLELRVLLLRICSRGPCTACTAAGSRASLGSRWSGQLSARCSRRPPLEGRGLLPRRRLFLLAELVGSLP